MLTNGLIRTCDPDRPVASAVLLAGGRVAWVGSTDMAPQAGRSIDLKGACVIPGLTDAHAHMYMRALERLDVELGRDVRSIAHLQDRLRQARMQVGTGDWLVASGYNEFVLAEQRHPSLEELDAVAGGCPILLRRTGGHLAVANTAALRLAGFTDGSADPRAGTLERRNGCLTGVLAERAADMIADLVPKPSASRMADAMQDVARDCLQFGIVALVEAAVGFTSGFEAEWAVWEHLRGNETFGLRMGFMLRIDPAEALRLGLAPTPIDFDWQVRTLKFFVDGIIGARSAALSAPYADRDTLGLLMEEPASLCAKVAEAHAAGWQVAAHTIGDRAIDLWIDALRQAQRAAPRPDPRHRIEHFALPGESSIARAKDLNAVIVSQYGFLRRLGKSFAAAVGPERAQRLYPARSLLEVGITVAGSSDHPIGPLSPFLGMAAAIDRSTENGAPIAAAEGVTPLQALSAYTTAGAFVMGHEAHRGIIRAGALADLAVLDRDVLSVSTSQLGETRVHITIARGAIAYTDGALVS